ncbi:hypothetical protein MTP99_013472 [Tenebrio molitor]|jgi:hypothetical protein|nr:hypothetical protein MTP99_013472 [Tenebrio molitor]
MQSRTGSEPFIHMPPHPAPPEAAPETSRKEKTAPRFTYAAHLGEVNGQEDVTMGPGTAVSGRILTTGGDGAGAVEDALPVARDLADVWRRPPEAAVSVPSLSLGG